MPDGVAAVMRLWTIPLAASLVVSMAHAQDAGRIIRALRPVEVTLLQEAVRARLLDPASAQFRMDGYREGSSFYCGYVNAKNRFGGYTGFQPFVVRLAEDPLPPRRTGPIVSTVSVILARPDDNDIISTAIDQRCAQEGYSTSDRH